MKVSRAQMAANRQAILRAAARLFRERGFEVVTVAEVMAAAGLTHGGFYGHFRSKQDLMAQACAAPAKSGGGGQGSPPSIDPDRYLTARHRDDRANGCIFAALAADAPRAAPEVSASLTEGLRATLDRMIASGGAYKDKDAAIAALSGMVGGLILARLAAGDPTFSDEILAAVRATTASNR